MSYKYLLMFLLLMLLISTGCITEQERNGVSKVPFNTPDDNPRRTFNGDW